MDTRKSLKDMVEAGGDTYTPFLDQIHAMRGKRFVAFLVFSTGEVNFRTFTDPKDALAWINGGNSPKYAEIVPFSGDLVSGIFDATYGSSVNGKVTDPTYFAVDGYTIVDTLGLTGEVITGEDEQ